LAAGDYTFTLTVTDPYGKSGSVQVAVHVNSEPNQTPTLGVPASVSMVPGSTTTFQATGSDPDGDPLTYSLTSGPSWAAIDGSTGLVALGPPAGASGSFTVTVKVADPYGASASRSVSVGVSQIVVEGVKLTRKDTNQLIVTFNLRNVGTTVAT